MELSTVEQGSLLVLWLIWAGLLTGGFVRGVQHEEGARRLSCPVRMASSLVLVIAAWSWFVIAKDGRFETLAIWLAVGMTLGLLGDLILAELIPVGERVLGGMIAFGLGHIAYILGMLSYASANDLTDSTARTGALIVWLLFGAVGWYVIVYRGAAERGMLHIAALPYALLLAGTAGVATGLALQADLFILTAVGAALFLLSDLILAAQLFNQAYFWLIGDAIWLTYGVGQMLIVYAAFFSVL